MEIYFPKSQRLEKETRKVLQPKLNKMFDS